MAVECGLLLVLAAVLAWGTALEKQQQRISGSLIRLHVTANSDSREDQAVKLRVRDAVLTAAEPMLAAADSREEAIACIQRGLEDLENAANEALSGLGSPDRASVTLQRELFGTREYETFSLPGGYYDALRVTIGSGAGRNWWCVVYPQLCTAAAGEERTAAVMGGLSPQDADLITRGKTQFRFRVLELFEDLMGWFRSGKDGIPTSG